MRMVCREELGKKEPGCSGKGLEEESMCEKRFHEGGGGSGTEPRRLDWSDGEGRKKEGALSGWVRGSMFG